VLNPDPAPRPRKGHFARRLLSLSGVLPLGAFLLAHLAINARALRGDAAFVSAVHALHGIPGLALLEWLFVFAPLVVHATVGLWLVVTRRPLAEPSPYPDALRTAVRATGVAAIAFLALHLPELRFRTPGARLDGDELAAVLMADLSSTWHGVPWRGAAYLAGAACVTFHFAAGLWAFFATTRAGRSARARKWGGWGAAAIGAATWVMFANIVVFHATGARLLGKGEEQGDRGAQTPCPVDSASGQ
jgi:succinate dehydrogenase/fumarate reductase cytochrome b subunit (b558 family)